MKVEVKVLDISDADIDEWLVYCKSVLEPNGYQVRGEFQDGKALLIAERRSWKVTA